MEMLASANGTNKADDHELSLPANRIGLDNSEPFSMWQ
jgi:hypothetical protein